MKKELRYGQKYIYESWRGMRKKCYNPTDNSYEKFGGRGISICDEWQSFENFYQWSLLNGYKEGLHFSRRDYKLNYDPGNSLWDTKANHSSRKEHTRKIEYNGEIISLQDAARKYGINHHTLADRLERGWTVEKSLTTETLPPGYAFKCNQPLKKRTKKKENSKKRIPIKPKVHPLSEIWKDMHDKCYIVDNPSYDKFYTNCIDVCKEWHDYDKFYNWSINNGYADGLFLIRNNDSYGYKPSNCRWGSELESLPKSKWVMW